MQFLEKNKYKVEYPDRNIEEIYVSSAMLVKTIK